MEPNTEPKKEPWEINSMDDLRAAMNSPEIQEANKAFSKKYLKANRPKSLAVVICSVAAVLLLMSLTSHKASSVTPVALRTADQVEFSLEGYDAVSSPAVLTTQQRDALMELLDSAKVKRLSTYDDSMPVPNCVFTADGSSFTLTYDGLLLTSDNAYEILSPGADEVWTRLTDILAS